MAESKKKKRHRGLKVFLEIQAVLILIVIGLITYYYVGGYASQVSMLHNEAVRKVNSANEDTFRSAETSIAYDSDGNILSILKGEKDSYYLIYSEIPIYAKEAIISIEDKKFYSHRGVDYKAIVRAAYAMVRNGKVTQGASTITQQLARNIFLTQDRTWERKIEEIYIALELEKRYSKNQILEYYLNNIYFANGYYGIEAAARGYFSMPAKELTLSQIAFLCAIPNSPTRYDPIEDITRALNRRNLILQNMRDDGIISIEEYQAALSEQILLTIQKTEKHDYQETYTFYCATRALMSIEEFEFKNSFRNDEEKKKYEEEYDALYNECNRMLYEGGYRIYTSLDSNMQDSLQEALDSELSGNEETNEEGIYALQGSAVCIDNETGLVKAIVGGRLQDYEGYTLNRAYQSFRQPGSSIKPLIVYTPALERTYTPDTIVVDEPIPEGPSNSGGGYLGSMSLRRAVEMSRNTIAWKIFEELSPVVGLSYLRAMNFSRITDTDEVPAASLGGLSNGVSALEMAAGFSALENEGFYREPTCIYKITDSMGNTVYQPQMIKQEIYKANAAKEMTDILRGVLISPGATGVGLGVRGVDCAGKTGTTNDNKDGWFVGYSAYYTTSVWVGFDMPRKLPGLWGSTIPGRIWHNYMAEIHEELEYRSLNSKTIYYEPQEGNDDIYTLPEVDDDFTEPEDTMEMEDIPDIEENLETDIEDINSM